MRQVVEAIPSKESSGEKARGLGPSHSALQRGWGLRLGGLGLVDPEVWRLGQVT